MDVSHADDFQKLQFREKKNKEREIEIWEGWELGWLCEIKSGRNTRDGSPSTLRSHLQKRLSPPAAIVFKST